MADRVVWTFIAKDKFTRAARNIKKQTAGMQLKFSKLNRTMSKTAAGLGKIASKLKGMSIAAAAATVGFSKTFGDIEAGLANVFTLLSNEEFEKYGSRLKKVAAAAMTEFGFKTDEISVALFDTVSALGANERAFEAWGAGLKLAVAGVAPLNVALDGITSLMNAYGDAAGTAESISNKMFAAQKGGKITIAQLSANVGKVAPVAYAAGISLDELLAIMAQLTLGGLSAEEAATSLKGAFVSLLKPSKESEKILRKFGVAYGASALAAQPFVKTLEQINALRKKDADLLVQAIPNIRGFLAIASLEEKQLKNLSGIMENMRTDQLGPALATAMATQNRQLSIARGNLTMMASEVGEQLKPAIISLVKGIRALHDWFVKLNPFWKKAIALITVLVTVVAPVVWVLSKLFGILALGWPIIQAIGMAFGMFAATVGFIPIAIGLAIAALGLLWWKFDLVKEKAREAWAGIKNFFGGGSDEDINISGKADITNTSKAQVDVNFNDPKGIVNNIKTKTTGSSLDLGVNLAGAS